MPTGAHATPHMAHVPPRPALPQVDAARATVEEAADKARAAADEVRTKARLALRSLKKSLVRGSAAWCGAAGEPNPCASYCVWIFSARAHAFHLMRSDLCAGRAMRACLCAQQLGVWRMDMRCDIASAACGAWI